jgi:hypothetical protein
MGHREVLIKAALKPSRNLDNKILTKHQIGASPTFLSIASPAALSGHEIHAKPTPDLRTFGLE